MSIKKEKICVLDLETSGFEPEDCEILEIFILKVSNDRLSILKKKNLVNINKELSIALT